MTPADRIAEIEKALDALVDASQEWCPEHDPKCNAKHRARELAERAALLAAITRREEAVRVAALKEAAKVVDCDCADNWCDRKEYAEKIRALIKEQP